MSIRVDSSSWISGAIVVGHRGLGVLAENISSTGDAGASFLYNDLSLPTDNGKEICGRITAWPTNGTLVADETGAFTYTPLSDGADAFSYQLKVDGVDVGAPVTVSLQVGSPIASFVQSTADAVSVFAARVLPMAAFSVATADAAFTGGAGTVAAASFTGQTADVTVSGGATSKPVAVLAATLADTVFAGGASIAGAPATCSFAVATADTAASFSATVVEVVLSEGGFSVSTANATFSGSATGSTGTLTGSLSDEDVARIAAAVLQAIATLQPGVVQVNVVNRDEIVSDVWSYERP